MRQLILSGILLLLPLTTYAQVQDNLVNIPGLQGDTVGAYVAALFYLAIGIAALFAVVKLVIAGAKYMLSDVSNTKESAKSDIRGAIIGLLLILGTVLILETIDDNILDTNIVLREIEIDPGNGWGGGGGGDDKTDVEEAEEECDDEGGVFIVNPDGSYLCGTASLEDVVEELVDPTDPEAVEQLLTQLEEDYDLIDEGHSDAFPTDDQDALEDAIEGCRERGGSVPIVVQQTDGSEQSFLMCAK